MKSNLARLIVIVSVLAMLSLACGIGSKKEPTETPRPTTVKATETLKPPAASAVPPTKTAVPPTNTPAVTATPAPDLSLGEENRCEACGFSFRPIPGYTLTTSASIVTMLAEGANTNTGPVVMLMGGQPQPGLTTESLLASLKSDTVTLSDPTDILVAGIKGVTVFASGTDNNVEMAGQIVIIFTPAQQFVAIAASPKDQWQREGGARFSAVLNSITFFTPILPVTPTQTPASSGEAEIRQWAVSAVASSWYGTGTEWSPSQATGAPNVTACADNEFAWASSESDAIAWIELTYATPVYPTQVNIVQSYNPSYVVKVELKDTLGNYHEVYTGEVADAGACPYTLSIPINSAAYQVNSVIVTINQSTLDDWNEIDAVELVGKGTAGVAPASKGFLWRMVK